MLCLQSQLWRRHKYVSEAVCFGQWFRLRMAGYVYGHGVWMDRQRLPTKASVSVLQITVFLLCFFL